MAKGNQQKYYTYILKCADETLYTGWTTNLEARIEAHNSGAGAKYTRSRTPVSLLASWIYENKIDAMKREYAIKQMSRQAKLNLVETTERASSEPIKKQG